MGKYAVVLIGPAGSGKSTLCKTLSEHYSMMGRTTHICNFDPAAEFLQYEPSVDVRDLISLDDAMEGKGLGPNGGLVFCMEYLMENLPWLSDALGDYMDDFVIIDMPGQVELQSHIPVVPTFVEFLKQEGYNVAVLFLLDALSATADAGKFVSGCLFSLSSMVSMDCSFINVLTKCDLLPSTMKEHDLEHFCMCDFDYLKLQRLPPKWKAMTRALCSVIDDFQLVAFRPMDINEVEYITNLAGLIDDTLQVTDDAEVKDRDFDEEAMSGLVAHDD
jgi:GPN-loop GTPase